MAVKSILSPYRDGWFASDYTMNLYRGCCHGCVYCDSRSECYRIDDFDTVRAKAGALTILRRELAAKRRVGVVMTGSMGDPYNPYESKALLTRGALSLLARQGFGAVIMTKSALAVRDADVLRDIARHAPVAVLFTVTAAQDCLSHRIEPGVCPSSQRFAAVRALTDAGILCGILLMPVLPFITDTRENILSIIEQAAQSGAKFVCAGMNVSLRDRQRLFYYRKLDEYFPGVADQYREAYGDAYWCPAPDKGLHAYFEQICAKHGLLFRQKDMDALVRAGWPGGQVSPFDGE